MIIKCNDNKKKEVLDYIGEEYGKCLYLYIDLVKYGCESEFVKVWKVIGDDGVTMVMLAYHSALHLYSIKLNFDLQEIIPFINEIKVDGVFLVAKYSIAVLYIASLAS